MEVSFSDSFSKSLIKTFQHDSFIYKAYAFFRYKIPSFLKNVWRFRKELWDHRWWDYRFTLSMLSRSLKIMEEGINTKGHEVDSSRMKKVQSMRRAIQIIENYDEYSYISKAESEMGELAFHEWEFEKTEHGYSLIDYDTPEEKEHNRKVFERARELEEEEWSELWEIFKGTKNSKQFDENYDGTDMRGWWD